MKVTSAEAAKILRAVNEEIMAIREKEDRSATFIASLGEEVESVRPAYSYEEAGERIAALEAKVRLIKHAMNQFNISTEVPGFSMTVDQMLVYIPQLTQKKKRLSVMAARLPKERVNTYGAKTIVEYTYTNYDPEQAAADLVKVNDELARAQTALDVVNNSLTMEIELD